ncbi:hypothetical protein D3C81_1643900 [compost metagenome]
MDRRGARRFSDSEDFIDCQVSAGGCAFTEAVGFVGLQDVQAGGIGFGVDGSTLYFELTQGAQDAAGNGATVGNQDFFKHGITPDGDAGRPAVFLEAPGPSPVKNLFSSEHHRSPVGAGLLAKRACQSTLMFLIHRFREQARSHI